MKFWKRTHNFLKIRLSSICIFLLLTSAGLVLSSCIEPTEEQDNLTLFCINNHLYFKLSAYYGLAPLYRADSEVPTLIECKRVENKIEFDRKSLTGGI